MDKKLLLFLPEVQAVAGRILILLKEARHLWLFASIIFLAVSQLECAENFVVPGSSADVLRRPRS